MGLSNDIPFPAILIAGIGFAAADSFRWAKHNLSKTYDYLEDRVDETSELLLTTKDGILFQTGLSPPSDTLQIFHQFPLLPTEIRLQIWTHAIQAHGPRVIELRHNKPGPVKRNIWSRYRAPFPGLTSTARIPALLHTCRESRSHALETYTLSFATDGRLAKVFIDFSRDVVFFGPRSDYSNIQYLSKRRKAPGLTIDTRKTKFYGSMHDLFTVSTKGTEEVQTVPTQGFEQIKFMALRAMGMGAVGKTDYRVFQGVEEVILVGEKDFELGPEPTLKVEELERGLLRAYADVYHNAIAMQRRNVERKLVFTEWRPPVVKGGLFVKGSGDRWFCVERGRCRFG